MTIKLSSNMDKLNAITYSDKTTIDSFTKTYHSVQISVSGYKGVVSIEGALQAEPEETDWFTMYSEEFPQANVALPSGSYTQTATIGYSSNQIFKSIRVKSDQSGIENISNATITLYGYVDNVFLSI